MRLTRAGALVLGLPGGRVVQHAPVAYQAFDGARHPVVARFRVRAGRLRLDLGAYDHAHELIVDPGIAFSTYLGGTGTDGGAGIAVDSTGQYVTGSTSSTDFPTQTPLYASNAGGSDAFVAKLNPAGSALIYSTYLGGSGNDSGSGIAIDGSGDAYVIGSTTSSNFPTSAGAYQSSYSGSSDAFLAKLNPSGSSLSYSSYLGSVTSGKDSYGYGIAVNGSDAYVTGLTYQSGFPTTGGAYKTTSCSDYCGFVTELDTSQSGASSLVASTLFGSAGHTDAYGIALDSDGDVYITGDNNVKPSGGIPTTSGAYQTTNSGSQVAFVTEFDPTLTSLVYSSMLGGSSYQLGLRIAVTTPGIVYVAGYTASTDFPTTMGAAQAAYGGGNTDVFVAEFNTANSGSTSLVYSTYLGGNGFEDEHGLAIDGSGDAWVAGSTSSGNFPTESPLQSYGGDGDAFVSELNPAGTSLMFSSFLGGAGADTAGGIALGSGGYAYVTGQTSSSDFPTKSALQAGLGGNAAYNAFIAKIGPRLTATAVACTPSPGETGTATACTATVTDTAAGNTAGPPTGTVSFGTDSTGMFGSSGMCTLSASATAASSCSVSYTPSVAGTHHITATYGASGDWAGSGHSTPLTVDTAPGITSQSSQTFTVGAHGTFTVTTSGTPSPALSITSGTLPTGVTFTDDGDGTATLAGTPAAGTGGSHALTIKASNGASPDATQSFTLTVHQAPAVTSAATTAFTAGSAGAFAITSTGFPTAALSEAGPLPSGVSFHDNGNGTAALSGTPAPGSAGTYPIALKAANGVSPSASQSFTLVVNAGPSANPPSATGGGSGGSATESAGGSVTVPGVAVTCPAGSAGCTVDATLTAMVSPAQDVASASARKKKHRKAKPRVVTLATASFALASGHRGAVVLRLSAAGQRLLKGKHRLAVTVKITILNRTGMRSTTVVRSFTLLAPRR
jgi:hypothetical protein